MKVSFCDDPLEIALKCGKQFLRLLVVVNLFNIFLYFVILHEDLKIQRLQLDL